MAFWRFVMSFFEKNKKKIWEGSHMIFLCELVQGILFPDYSTPNFDRVIMRSNGKASYSCFSIIALTHLMLNKLRCHAHF